MNKIRKRWKKNGTPFYFQFRYDNLFYKIDDDTCKYLDTVEFDDCRHTCMDILVDIHFMVMSLQHVSSSVIYESVKYELYTILELVLKCSHLEMSKIGVDTYVFKSPKNS